MESIADVLDTHNVPSEQEVEAPKASFEVRLHGQNGEASGFECDGLEGVKALIKTLRGDINDRLDRQHEVLSLLLKPKPRRFSRVSEVPRAEAAPPTPPPPPRGVKPQKTNFTPQLFSTFTQHDLAHAEMANMKDEALAQAEYAKTTASQEEGKGQCLQRLVKSNAFDLCCALIVISNSVFLGVEVEMSIASGGERNPTLQAIQFVYSGWFLLELVLRFAVDGRKLFYGEDWMWAWLDVFVVVTSLWEVIVDVMYIVMESGTGGEVPGVSGLKALRIIRITRIVKAIRLMRVFRFVMAFRTLITSILYTLKSLFWAVMLLFVIVYVFAVLFTQAVNDYVADPARPLTEVEREASKNFASLDATMLNLFMSIAGGVSWGEVLPPLHAVSYAWVGLYVFYIAFTQFAVLNVVTGVFCQSAIESAQNDHTTVVHSILKNKALHVNKLRKLFSNLGDGSSEAITFAIFEEKISSPDVQAYFEVMGLDVDDAWSFFKLLDLDDGGDVEIEEFLMGCLRLRGTARAIDVGKIIHDQTWLIKNQGKFQTWVEVELRRIQEHISSFTGQSMGLPSVQHSSAAHSAGSNDDNHDW